MDKHQPDEQSRLAALRALALPDSSPAQRFDQLSALAGAALGTPIAPDQLELLRALAGMAEVEIDRDTPQRVRQPDSNASLEARVAELTLALEQKNQALNREIRQRTDIEASLRRSNERVRTMIESSFSAFVATDEAFHIVEWNGAAERIFGWSRAEVLGRPWSSIMRGTLPEVGGSAGAGSTRVTARTSFGGDIVVDMSADAFTVDGRQYLGVFINDVTAQLTAATALEQKQELLDAVLDTVDVAVIACDAAGKLTFFNRAAREFHGRQPDNVPSFDWAAQYDLYQADGQTPLAAGEIPLLRALAGDSVKDHRIVIAPHGLPRRTVLSSGRVLRSPSGERIGAVVAMHDVTELAASQDKLRNSEQMLRTITDNVPVLISYVDSEMRYQFANAMYRDWLGMPTAQMIGRTVTEVFGLEYFEERAASIERALAGHMSSIEVKVVRKGHERILNTTYMPHQRDGRVVGIYVLATDATAARVHERKLLALANADPLTNLPNRRMYEFHLAKALALSKRQKTRLALMYLDLDDFKRINDTHGHGAGDAVLVEFGRRVGTTLRETDLLARLAGDEFTVVLEAVDSLANCETIAYKIQQALLAPYHFDGRSLQISASIGIALADLNATVASLSMQADEALYSAKRKGKNRYAVLQE